MERNTIIRSFRRPLGPVSAARTFACLGALACLFAVGCEEPPPEPVARLSVEPTEIVLPHGERVSVETRWEMLAPLEAEGATPFVFVHLLGEEGEVLRTFDHPLPFPWQVGETAVGEMELWQSAIDPELPAGEYPLAVGLYRPDMSERWALEVPGDAGSGAERRVYRIGRVRVPAPPEEKERRLAFLGNWLSADRSSDRQMLTSRWLVDRGDIEVWDLEEPAVLQLTLRLPELPEERHRLSFEEGEVGPPALLLSATCGGGEVRVSGFGRHRVELPLDPSVTSPAGSTGDALSAGTAGGEAPSLDPGAEDRCRIRLEPNFVYLDLTELSKRSVRLENVTWKAGATPAPVSDPEPEPAPADA